MIFNKVIHTHNMKKPVKNDGPEFSLPGFYWHLSRSRLPGISKPGILVTPKSLLHAAWFRRTQSCNACNKARATRLVVDKGVLKINAGQNASYNGHDIVIFIVKLLVYRIDGFRNAVKNNESNGQLLYLRKLYLKSVSFSSHLRGSTSITVHLLHFKNPLHYLYLVNTT